MGLLYTDFKPKKSFFAYKFLVSKIAGMEFDRPLDLGHPDSKGFVFRDGKDSVAVVWTWSDSKEVTLTLSAKEARVLDKLGTPLSTVKADKAGKLRLKLTPDPLYVLFQE